jgi:hypothetical protein
MCSGIQLLRQQDVYIFVSGVRSGLECGHMLRIALYLLMSVVCLTTLPGGQMLQ